MRISKNYYTWSGDEIPPINDNQLVKIQFNGETKATAYLNRPWEKNCATNLVWSWVGDSKANIIGYWIK